MTKNAFFAPDLDALPPELTGVPHWVLWRAVEKIPGSKPTKVPYQANGRPAKSTDPTTWADFETVKAAYLRGGYTGIGFVLNGDGLAGVDLDHVRDPDTEEIAAAAQAILGGLGAAYVEVSPSGTGLRAFGYADALPRGAKGKLDGVDCELYTDGRYLTVTGNALRRGVLAPFVGFNTLAERLRPAKTPTSTAGDVALPDAAGGLAEALRIIQTGDSGLHDALRDAAASWAATGMAEGAIVKTLHALMDASAGPHDDRWKARYAEIPGLVSSAAAKFAFEKLEPELDGRLIPLSPDGTDMFDELPHVLASWVPADEVTLLSGHGGTGKSFLALVMAVHVALGRPFGALATRQAPVLFASCEDGKAVLQLRLRRICAALQIDSAELAGKLHLLDASDMDSALYREHGGREALPTAFLAGLRGMTERLGVGLVIVDNASDTYAANEIDRTAVRGFIRTLRTEIARPGRAVLLLAHVSKAGARLGAEDAQSFSGSTAWHNSVRSRLALFANKDGSLTVDHQKANLGPLAAPMTLERVAGGVPLPIADEWGDCPAGEMVKQAQAAREQAEADAVLSIVRDFDARGEHIPTAATGPYSAFRTLAPCAGFPEGMTAPRLNETMRRLERDGRVKRAERRTPDRKVRSVFTCQPTGGEG